MSKNFGCVKCYLKHFMAIYNFASLINHPDVGKAIQNIDFTVM